MFRAVYSTIVRRFVHRTCDPEADPITHQKKLEMIPDYQYVCPTCKNMSQYGRLALKRKESMFADTVVKFYIFKYVIAVYFLFR